MIKWMSRPTTLLCVSIIGTVASMVFKLGDTHELVGLMATAFWFGVVTTEVSRG